MSAIAGGILGLFGNLMTNASNAAISSQERAQELELFNRQQDFAFDEARRAEAFSKEESELAFEREKEMWNMQNEYNSPSEQMRRYKDAGLNPMLIYGQGTPGNAQTQPSYNPVSGQKSDVLSVPKLTSKARLNFDFSQLMEYQKLANQEKFTESQIRYTDAQTKSTEITNYYKDANEQLDINLKMLKFKYDTNQISEQELNMETKKLTNEGLRLQNEFNKRTLESRIALIQQEFDLNEKQMEVVNKNLSILSEDVKIKKLIQQEYKDKHQLHSATDIEQFAKTINKELELREKSALLQIANVQSETSINDTFNMSNKQWNFIYKLLKMFFDNQK